MFLPENLDKANVYLGETETVFVVPPKEGHYSFRVAASLWQVDAPDFVHGEEGHVVTFGQPLSVGDIKHIARVADGGYELPTVVYAKHLTAEEMAALHDEACARVAPAIGQGVLTDELRAVA